MEAVLGNGPPSVSGLGEIAAGASWSSISLHTSPQLIPERSWLTAPLLLLALFGGLLLRVGQVSVMF